VTRVRKLLLAALLLPLDGWKRATVLRRLGVFHGQGRGCYFSITNFGNEPWLLSFGDNVYVAADVRFVTHDVSALMMSARTQDRRRFDRMGEIRVGDNVFVGLGSIILPGVSIADDVVVGAGAVVARSIDEPGVWVGNPPRKTMTIEEYEEKLNELAASYPWCTGDSRRMPRNQERVLREEFFWHRP